MSHHRTMKNTLVEMSATPASSLEKALSDVTFCN